MTTAAPDPAWGPPDPRAKLPNATAPDPGNHLVRSDRFAGVRARWLPLIAILTLIATLIVASVLTGLTGGDGVSDELFGAMLYLPLVVWAVVVARRHHIDLRALFRRPRIGHFWWVVLGLTVAQFSFSIGASAITAALFPDFVAGAEVSTEAGFGVVATSLIVLPPLVEELVFRGMLLERWTVKWRIGVAIVVQAIAFGVLHVDPVGAGLFGVVMALMYLRTRTLWVPIAMHAINNGVVLLAVFTAGEAVTEDSTQTIVEALIAGIVFMGISLPFIVWFIWRNWPDASTLTPYEEHEFGPGALPPRHLGRVEVVAGPFGIGGQRGRLWVEQDRIVVTADTRGRRLWTSAPYVAIHAVGIDPAATTIIFAAADGSRLELALPQRSTRYRRSVTTAVVQRLRAAGVPEPVWTQ